jgi:catechol 2,3-dioxygenase-like lactoylglutathione lyase family enzyme
MLTAIDHFIILVNDLATATETYRGFGFDVCAGGEHPAFGSHNALIALADGAYLELLAFRDPTLAQQTFWSAAVDKLRVGQGFENYALLSNDIADDVRQIRARGLECTDPLAGSRLRPDGQRVEWRTAMIGATRSAFLPFLIQDETPRELRIESAHEGLGSRLRVKQITVAVNDLELAKEKYRALLAIEPRHVQNIEGDVQGYRFTTAWGKIILAHPERTNNAMSDQLEQRGEGLHAISTKSKTLSANSSFAKGGNSVTAPPRSINVA